MAKSISDLTSMGKSVLKGRQKMISNKGGKLEIILNQIKKEFPSQGAMLSKSIKDLYLEEQRIKKILNELG